VRSLPSNEGTRSTEGVQMAERAVHTLTSVLYSLSFTVATEAKTHQFEPMRGMNRTA